MTDGNIKPEPIGSPHPTARVIGAGFTVASRPGEGTEIALDIPVNGKGATE